VRTDAVGTAEVTANGAARLLDRATVGEIKCASCRIGSYYTGPLVTGYDSSTAPRLSFQRSIIGCDYETIRTVNLN